MPGELTILGNPGHGNGPSVILLLVAEALQELTGAPVHLIIPRTSAAQARIISSRKGNPSVRVYYDASLGAATFAVTLRGNDFSENLSNLQRFQTGSQLLSARYLEGGLQVESEEGPSRQFAADQIALELNVGSRIRFSPVGKAFYFFPCLLSDLLKRRQESDGGGDAGVAAAVERVEKAYDRIFLPSLHTFSWDASWAAPDNACFVPFLREAPKNPPALPQRGVLAMPSGVGSAGNPLLAQAVRQLVNEAGQQGRQLEVYYPQGTPLAELPDARPAHPDAMFSESLECVVGRAGWGTLSECLSAGTPFVAIPEVPGDDPEIRFNLKTLAASGVAAVHEEGRTMLEPIENAKEKMDLFRKELEQRFGTANGYRFMAAEMLKHLDIPAEAHRILSD